MHRHGDGHDPLPAPAPDPARRWLPRARPPAFRAGRRRGAAPVAAGPRACAAGAGRRCPPPLAGEVESRRVGVVAPGSAAAIGAVRLGRLGVGHDALMVPAVPESSRRPGALLVCSTPIGNLVGRHAAPARGAAIGRSGRLRGHPPHPHPARSATASRCPCWRCTSTTRPSARRSSWSASAAASGWRWSPTPGMPAVSDPGALLVAAVAAAGLPVIVLPGAVGGDRGGGRRGLRRERIRLRRVSAQAGRPRGRRAAPARCLPPTGGRVRVAAAAAGDARRAGGGRPRPPGRGVPRAHQAPRAGRARPPGRPRRAASPPRRRAR